MREREDFIQENLHDSKVVAQRFEEDCFVMEIDSSGGFTSVESIRFFNARVHRINGFPNGTFWDYDEQYRVDDGYEIHIYGTRNHECVIKTSGVTVRHRKNEA